MTGTPNTDDLFIVDFTHGNPIPSGGLFFDGAESSGDNDMLVVKGNGNVATYTPDASNPGAGTVLIGSSLIHFTNLEPLDVSGMSSFTLDLPNGDDVIDIANGFDLTITTVHFRPVRDRSRM